MLYDVLTASAHSAQHISVLADPIFDPKTGEAPPGADKLQHIMQWIAWIVFSLCVVGILLTAGKMAVSHSRGQGGEHASSLAWVLGACILAGSASALVGFLV